MVHDDFDAFYAIAHSKLAIEVQVSIEDTSPPQARSSLSPAVVFQKAVSPTALNADLPFSSSEVPAGDEVRPSRRVTFLDPSPDSQDLPPEKRRRATLSSTLGSTGLEDSRPETPVVVPTQETTDAAKDQSGPVTHSKKKRRADNTESETPSVETSAKNNSTSAVANVDNIEAVTKPKPKKRPKKTSDPEAGTTLTSKQLINGTATTPKSQKPEKQSSKTAPNNFPQQLAQIITGGHLVSAEPEGTPSEDRAPSFKRVKRRNSVAGQCMPLELNSVTGDVAFKGQNAKIKASEKLSNAKAKAAEPVLDGASTEQEHREGQINPKKKKKKEDPEQVTPAELETVRGEMNQLIASLTSGVTKTKAQSSRQTNGLHQKPTSSAEILSVAKRKNTDRIGSSTAQEANAALPPTNKIFGPAETTFASSSESSEHNGDGSELEFRSNPTPQAIPIPNASTLDDIDSGTYLEELIGGPVKRRLTLDSILPFAMASDRKRKAIVLEEDPVIERKSARRSSRALDSDSDNAGYESASDNVETVSSSLPGIDQPPTLEISNKDSVLPSATAKPRPDAAVVLNAAASPGQVSPAETTVNETITEHSPEMLHPVALISNQMDKQTLVPPSAQRLSSSQNSDFVVEHDPIEAILPSPRSHSPIETALASITTLPSARPSTTRTHSKPEIILARRSTRKTNTQPISKHEVDVRQSVVRLTRSRSKSEAQTRIPPNPVLPPSPAPAPPLSPRRLHSATQPDRATASAEYQTPASVIANGSHALDNMWVTLHAGPSSPADPESSRGSDELHSSPERERASPTVQPDVDPEAPLFIASESQINFPYSQFQDIDADSDNGAADAPVSVSRLEEDSEEEDEVQHTITPITPRQTRRTSTAYRGLSEIASQNKFFTGFHPNLVATSTPHNSKEDLYGPLSQAYNDDVSDSGSESEAEKSHIPKARRAGKKR
ncbi:hypothetical protein DFJ43DRAFT_1153094 [Lentinula guzmanii]|uniref:Uncharacterized protein n=1 Tax=Lentinula guzmanii TaxID=2804957 RepID=A0AA38JMZ2_9AGAR|nr:hypothetical protein DFJ43DRAFT_1153094 [Lentinula guzmanii]